MDSKMLKSIDIKARRKARRIYFMDDPARFRTREIQIKKRKKELKPKYKYLKFVE